MSRKTEWDAESIAYGGSGSSYVTKEEVDLRQLLQIVNTLPELAECTKPGISGKKKEKLIEEAISSAASAFAFSLEKARKNIQGDEETVIGMACDRAVSVFNRISDLVSRRYLEFQEWDVLIKKSIKEMNLDISFDEKNIFLNGNKIPIRHSLKEEASGIVIASAVARRFINVDLRLEDSVWTFVFNNDDVTLRYQQSRFETDRWPKKGIDLIGSEYTSVREDLRRAIKVRNGVFPPSNGCKYKQPLKPVLKIKQT